LIQCLDYSNGKDAYPTSAAIIANGVVSTILECCASYGEEKFSPEATLVRELSPLFCKLIASLCSKDAFNLQEEVMTFIQKWWAGCFFHLLYEYYATHNVFEFSDCIGEFVKQNTRNYITSLYRDIMYMYAQKSLRIQANSYNVGSFYIYSFYELCATHMDKRGFEDIGLCMRLLGLYLQPKIFSLVNSVFGFSQGAALKNELNSAIMNTVHIATFLTLTILFESIRNEKKRLPSYKEFKKMLYDITRYLVRNDFGKITLHILDV
jgi:hypothetical protein